MTSPKNEDQEINLLDYLAVIIKRRRMIARNALVAALVMAVITFILPSMYQATTTLLPPDEGNQGGLGSLLANSPIPFLDMPGLGGASSSEIFVEILNSRTVAKGVLSTKYKFEEKTQTLSEIFDINSAAKAVAKLQKQSIISSNEQGVIKISVQLGNPKLAADVANQFVEELDKVNQAKSLSKAKSSRIYIEEQLELTVAKLKEASRNLADYQEEFKALNLEEQTKVAIEQAGEIKGTIMAREVELEVARQTMKKNNPVILRLQKEVDELKKQFEQLQFGKATTSGEQKDYFIPFSEVPEVGLQYAELIREVKVQETVWQLLNQQFYSAKIQEARDTPTVQVLDKAIPPEKRSSPKRRMLVMIAVFLAVTFSIFAAFVMEFAEKVKDNKDDFKKINELTTQLKNDYREIKTRLNKVLKRS